MQFSKLLLQVSKRIQRLGKSKAEQGEGPVSGKDHHHVCLKAPDFDGAVFSLTAGESVVRPREELKGARAQLPQVSGRGY